MSEQKQVSEQEQEVVVMSPDGEAGFSLNWTMVDGGGAPVQVTMRGASVSDWKRVMRERAIFVDKARIGGWTYANPKATAAPTIGNSPIAHPLTPAPKAQAVAGGNKAIQELHVVKVEITPKPDGKAELKFFTTGHKFPDLYATRSVEQWVEALNWEAATFGAAAEYSEKLLVGYTLSDKLNTAGNPYKDIAYIKADTF